MQEKTFYDIEHESWAQRASFYDDLFASVSSQAIDDILDSFGDLQAKFHLDVACGTGHLVAAASKRGTISEGIDFSQPMLDVASANYPNQRFKVADATQLPYPDGSCDAVSCSFGLSHLEYPQAAVNEAFRVLKVGGRYAFTLWYNGDDGNELQAIVKPAFDAHITSSITLPEIWTQLRYADKDICSLIVKNAGFGLPTFKRLPIVWQSTNTHEALDFVDKLSIRNKIIIDSQLPATKQRIYEHILSEVEARRVGGVISIRWPALLTIVEKPV